MLPSKQSAIYLQSTIKQSIELEAVCGVWRVAGGGAAGEGDYYRYFYLIPSGHFVTGHF